MNRVRVRYLVFIWLLSITYLPGAGLVASILIDQAPWYWWYVSYTLYAQSLLALAIFLTMTFPERVSLSRVLGSSPSALEVREGLTVAAYMFFFSWAALYLVYVPLSYWVPNFVTYWLIEIPDLIYFDSGAYPAAPNLLNLLSLCVAAPLLEEIAFRGIILHRWASKYGLRSAIIGSSAVFGIVHPDFLGAFVFGVAMCVLYLRTQSLMLPIICHSAYNFVVWLLEIGYIIKDGPDRPYSLEQFQGEWLYGLLAGVVVVVWTWMYLRKPKPEVVWKLPDV